MTNYGAYRRMRTSIRQRLAWLRLRVKGERGFSLVEALVAVSVTAVAVVALVTALSSGAIAVGEVESETVAQRLARAQLEHIKGLSYDVTGASYSILDAPEGYLISLDYDSVPETDSNIQKITATISREGEDVLVVEDYKVDR